VPDGFLLQRAFLERLVLINKTLEKHSEATKYDMQIAISYEKEAQWKLKNYPQGHSVAASIYEEAAQKYADLGVSKKVGEMKKKIQKHNLIGAQTEMKTIVSKVSVPIKPIEDFMNKLLSLSLSDALNNIAKDKMFVPGVARIRKITEEQKKIAPVSFVIPRVSIRNGKPALKSKNEKEIFEDHLVGNIVRRYKVASSIISLIIRKLVDAKGLDADSFAAILENSKIFKKEKLEIIKIGLERHFAGDYVSSIHVLTPQLEAAIREILKELGETTISLHQGVLREKPLDEVLRSPKMKSFLGENIWNYLKAFLIDKRGDNIRHDVAHGLISKERCNENTSTTILHQLLILSQLIFPKSIT